MWEIEFRLLPEPNQGTRGATGKIAMGGLEASLKRLTKRVMEHLGNKNEIVPTMIPEGYHLHVFLYWNPSRIHYSRLEPSEE